MNKDKFIPFALPDIGEQEIEAVSTTLRSGWVTTGPKTTEFEHEFASYLGGGVEAIAVNSATSGLHLALEACGIKAQDEVIIPTLTFTATAEVIRYLGADPVFVDCDLQNFNLDIGQIESKITPRTKAIIPVHMAGFPCNMPQILSIARRYNLKVIEDAAHALPSKFEGVMIGQHDSDAIVYSFYATKTITTGEGGMIVTKNQDIARRCKIMRLHGISRDAFDRYTSKTPSWYYEVIAPGFKYNLTDIASSLGLVQLKRSSEFHNRRSLMAQRYYNELSDLKILLPPNVSDISGSVHSWHLFIVRLASNAGISRDEFISAMSKSGVGTSVHFIPLHLQPYWQNTYELNSSDFPNANEYYANAVSLPIYTKMTDEDQSYVIKIIRGLLS